MLFNGNRFRHTASSVQVFCCWCSVHRECL